MDNQNVGGGGQAGTPAEPQQSASPETPKPIGGDVTQLLTQLEGKFSEQFGNLTKELRGLQSRQDKSESTFQQQLAKFNQIKTQGNLTDDQALAEMQRGDAEAQRWEKIDKRFDELAARIGGGGAPTNDSNAAAKVFESIGLDLKDVRVASALIRKYDTPEAVELAAYRLQREIAQAPNPSPAQFASSGSTSSGKKNVEELTQDYTKEIQEARGKGARFGEAIKQKYRDQGVPVDSITFKLS
jgi:hypothetical protein